MNFAEAVSTMANPLYALTLHRPWAWAIAHGPKRIENRSWAPPRWARGMRLAIHAGKTFNERDRNVIASRYGLSVPSKDDDPMGIVALATLAGSTTESDDPWFNGPVGWILKDVRALPQPVPARGAQGLWVVPPEIAQQVLAQLA